MLSYAGGRELTDAEVLEIGHLRDCNGKGHHSFLRGPGSVKAHCGPKSASTVAAGPGLEGTSGRRDG